VSPSDRSTFASAPLRRADRHPSLTRRSVLRGTLLGSSVAVLGAGTSCSSADPEQARTEPTPSRSRSSRSASSVLLAFFSRPGENYYYGDRRDLEVGNTKVLAGMIADRISCDVYEIRAADPYSRDYDATVARNVREQESDARPEIAEPLPALDDYDTVLLASPLWNVRPPMIMSTFAESLDFRGTTVHPVTTHAMSGLGTAERDYRRLCRGATLAEGLAVQGEEVTDSGGDLGAWLRRTGLAAA
jgi:flavodoxin